MSYPEVALLVEGRFLRDRAKRFEEVLDPANGRPLHGLKSLADHVSTDLGD